MKPERGNHPPGLLASIKASFFHEARLLLFSPLTYLFQAGLLVALAASVFLIGEYYASDDASIAPLITFVPWLGVIFVPALAMRSWSELGEGTTRELTYSLPASMSAMVLGKFFAGTLVLWTTLCFTAALPLTAFYLGEPDAGVIAAGYVGMAALLATYYALALAAAAIGREQIGAFVLGVVVLFLLLLLGWDVIARLLQGTLGAETLTALSLFSPAARLRDLARGYLDFGSLAYFAILTVAALAAASYIARARRRGRFDFSGIARVGIVLGLGVGVLALSIPLLFRVPGGIDLTAEGEFTLHPGTQSVLDSLPEGVDITFYWSASEPTVPVSVKSHARRVHDLLKAIQTRSAGKIQLRMLDPKTDSDEEFQALRQNIRKVPMSSGDNFYLGATLARGERVGRISYFDIRREGLLEYDIAVALSSLSKERIPKIGLLSPLLPSPAALKDREGLSFVSELRRAYDFAVIPFFEDQIPEGLDVLIVIDASVLKTSTLYAIDQFVMAGGTLIAMLDPYVRSNRGSNRVTPEPSDAINDISDLLSAYGARYISGSVVGDAGAAAQVQSSVGEALTYPYWLRLRQANMARDHAVTASLNEIFLVEPGAFELSPAVSGTALVTTGPKTGRRDRKAFQTAQPQDLARDFNADASPQVLAVSVDGPIKSAFAKPPDKADADAAKHKKRSTEAARVFAIGDVDWIFDAFALQRIEVSGETMVRPLNDNLRFFLNLVEFASGDDALISIRSRGRLHRNFTRVAALFADAEKIHEAEEARAAKRIKAIEDEIVALIQKSGVRTPSDLPEAARDKVRKYQVELLDARKRLRDVRRRSREAVNRLGTQLTAANIVSGPVLVLCLWFAVSLIRRRRSARPAA